MRPIHLDFLERPRVPIAPLGLLVLGLICACAVLGQWLAVRSGLQVYQQRVHSADRLIQERQRTRRLNQPDAAVLAQDAEARRKVQALLNYPWNRVFSTIEQSRKEHLTIVSFQHSQTEANSAMTVEATDIATVTQFVITLNEGLDRDRWYIASYRMPSPRDANLQANLLRR